jgi:hypothetical protein
MAKIIKLNENDLKRIVTKVLNERRLNEEDGSTNGLAPGAISQDVVDQLKYTENETGEPIERFRSICDVCTSGKDGLGPITQSEGALEGIAEKIYNAIEENLATTLWLGGTNMPEVKNGIRNTKTFPDFCFMIEVYSSKYEDFYGSMEGDFEDDSEQRMYLISPVVDVIQNSSKIVGKKSESKDKKEEGDEDLLVKAKKCGHKSVEDYKDSDWKCDSGSTGGGGSEEVSDNWNMYMCVIEHPDAKGEKFADGKRTRFRIGTDYYMGNGKKIRKGVELDYSCDDKEFRGISFADKEDETPIRGNKRPVDAEVMDIQKFLTDEGYDISTDGRIGSETSGAIIDYIVDNNSDAFKPASVLELQKKINSCYSTKIKEDGKAGPETLDAIADALESAQEGNLCK